MRHGDGILVSFDGSVYEGQWYKDYRNGEGLFTFPKGMTITGTWVKDRINGKGSMKLPNQGYQNVLFKDDIIINEEVEFGTYNYVYIICSVAMMLIFYASIALGYFIEDAGDIDPDLFYVGAYVWPIYVIYSLCT